jgi:hypothetical protein
MAHGDDIDETSADDAPAEDVTRRRFREALERKQLRRHATAEAPVRDGSEKSHGAQGPTKGRTFRRKSI